MIAVTGFIFISVSALVAGQISKNQQREAARVLEIRTRDALNDVSTGYYPLTGQGFSCSTASGSPVVTKNGNGDASRGTNTDCVIAGKKITYENNQMVVDTLVANARQPLTAIGQLVVVDNIGAPAATLREVIPYTSGITHAPPNKEVYVLNKLIAPSVNTQTIDVGGAQTVLVTDSSLSSSDTGYSVCFSVNGRLTQLLLGAKNSANATITMDVPTCS